MKKILLALTLLPLAAFAQGAGPGQGRQGGPSEMAQKRMRLARTLGLAEALDLDATHALKLSDQLQKVDEKRFALHQQIRDARQVLRRAAQGEKVSAAEVDQAIQKALDGRAQMHALDREAIATVTQGLSPDKKARAVLFLGRFEQRFPGGPGMGPGRHGGRGMGPGQGMGPGRGMGPMGMNQGMGPGPGAGDCPSCPWNDDDDE